MSETLPENPEQTQAPTRPPPIAPEERWRGVFETWQQSGLKPGAFCEQQGFSIGTFSYWRHRIRKLDGVAPSYRKREVPPHRKQAFLPVRLNASSVRPAVIEVVLKGGRMLRVSKGADEALLRMVIGALEGAGC
jgi:hypothetical protein